ncbi:MAG: hypothetical protein RMJ67_09835 [Elusimicrobiota bacterium]|nr:hypothetical protein [Endomicrobiia bacterium]MDW8166796.1 hypothetical protein [Elusimicrobiota bacterium]
MFRKFLFILLLLTFVTIITGCTPPKTILILQITSHPQGGYKVSQLSCSFSGYLSGGNKPITVTVEWWWENYYGANDTIEKTETYVFSSKTPTSYTTYISYGPNIYLLNFWWVKIYWTDDEGYKKIESNKVYCYVSSPPAEEESIKQILELNTN